MNAVYLFLVEASITVLPGALILVVWSKSLRRVLLDLCGTESRANFWLVYSNIMLLLTPLLFVSLFGLLAGVDIELATVLLAITLGGIGLWGVVHLTIKVIQPNYRVITPRVLKRFLACGYLAVFIAIQLFDPELQELAVIFLPPLLVTTHFMYLARGYLWQRVTGAK